MRNRVWVVMSLLGWGGPADVVPWIAGDDSCVGDACTVLSDCDAGAPDFDDGSAYGLARLVVKDDGVSGADIEVAVALVSVGVSSRRTVLPEMLGQLLLVAGRGGLPECRVGLRWLSAWSGRCWAVVPALC